MKVSKITIGRLYNLGSYEHVRYEISVEMTEGESPATAMIGLEKIIAALSPKTHTHSRDELNRELLTVTELGKHLNEMSEEEFRRRHGFFEGSPVDYWKRCEQGYLQNVSQRVAWEQRSSKARKLLEDLGGAANWKDSKMDWEDNDDNL